MFKGIGVAVCEKDEVAHHNFYISYVSDISLHNFLQGVAGVSEKVGGVKQVRKAK